jgi:hypothetical protein
MSDPIQLQILPTLAPIVARSQVNEAQVNALISLIATADPAIIELPSGKGYTDIKNFSLNIHPSGSRGMISVMFKN